MFLRKSWANKIFKEFMSWEVVKFFAFSTNNYNITDYNEWYIIIIVIIMFLRFLINSDEFLLAYVIKTNFVVIILS